MHNTSCSDSDLFCFHYQLHNLHSIYCHSFLLVRRAEPVDQWVISLCLSLFAAACVLFSHRHQLSDPLLFVSSTASSMTTTATRRRFPSLLNYCIYKYTPKSLSGVIPYNTSAFQISGLSTYPALENDVTAKLDH